MVQLALQSIKGVDTHEPPKWLSAYTDEGEHIALVWIARHAIGLSGIEEDHLIVHLRITIDGLKDDRVLTISVTRESHQDGENTFHITESSGEFNLEYLLMLAIRDPNQLVTADALLTERGLPVWDGDKKKEQKTSDPSKFWSFIKSFVPIAFVSVIILYNSGFDKTQESAIATGSVIAELQTSTDAAIVPNSSATIGQLVNKGEPLSKVDVTRVKEDIHALRITVAEMNSKLQAIPGEIRSLDAMTTEKLKTVALARNASNRALTLFNEHAVSAAAKEVEDSKLNDQLMQLTSLTQQRTTLNTEGTLAKIKTTELQSQIDVLQKQLAGAILRSPCTCYVHSVIISSGRITFTLIDPKQPLNVEVSLPRSRIAALVPGDKISFTLRGVDQKGTFEHIISEAGKHTRVGVSEAIWNNPKNLIIQVRPNDPIPWDTKLIGQPIHVLLWSGWLMNLATGFQMAFNSIFGA